MYLVVLEGPQWLATLDRLGQPHTIDDIVQTNKVNQFSANKHSR